jgi:hypothetical protein
VLAPPQDWADVRDRWQIAHLARTIAAVCAFIVLAAAVSRSGPPRRDASGHDRTVLLSMTFGASARSCFDVLHDVRTDNPVSQRASCAQP